MTADRHSALEPLAGALREASGDAVALCELPFLAQVGVRVEPAEAERLGLPPAPNTTVTAGARTALWLGPDEWLVVGPDGDAPAIERDLRAAAGDAWLTLVDLSANRTVLSLTGPRARDVLAHGCALDLHPRAFGPGHCAQALLARAAVILEARNPDGFRLFVRPSFAGYLAAWLIDAMAEYRAAPAPHPETLSRSMA